jgi:YD repeat-containing protein
MFLVLWYNFIHKPTKWKFMIKHLLQLVFLCCITSICQAQNLPEIVPPSPEASSLIKHSEMDVSLYTGLPSISVPFHTISYEGFDVPIGIGYNAGGIKVGDIAPWVGLGWNLNAGGLVSRSMRGLPDDTNTYGYMHTAFTVEDLFQRNPLDMDPTGQTWQLLADQAHVRDYEPDIFNFSFPGGGGQFFYDQTQGKFVQIPYSNLKIETKMNSNRIVGFIITNERGIKFHFGISANNSRSGLEALMGAKTITLTWNGVHESNPEVYGNGANPYYQSWMLMDIEFPKTHRTITFNYVTEANVKTTQLQNEEKIHVTGNCGEDAYNIIYLYKEFTQPKLESIVFAEGKVTFEKNNNERIDLHNSYPLKKINLFDKSNQLIKGYELHTSYFISSPNTNSYFDYFNEGIYRLKLDSISQFDKNLGKLPAYKFEYDSTVLPDRYSRSQDYFGYYNGKNNTTLIPMATYGYPGYIGDADRSVNPGFTNACSLKKIFYPTGGYDEFVWENNVITLFVHGNASNYVDHLIQNTIYFTNDSNLFPDSDPNIDFSKVFTISPNSDGIVKFTSNMTGCTNPNMFNDTSCDFTLTVVGISNPSFILNIYNSNFNYTLPSGTYKIIGNSNGSGPGCNPMTDPTCTGGAMFGVTMKWTTDPTPGEFMYGGLRIAQIKTYGNPTNLALTRNFSYNKFYPNSGLSSGVALYLPTLSMPNYKLGCNQNALKITSNIDTQLSLVKGGLVGYSNVTESYSGTSGIGRKEYIFSKRNHRFDNPYDGVGYYSSPFPSNFRNYVDTDWSFGNLEELKYYDASNNLVKQINNEYEGVNTFHGLYFGIQIMRMPGMDYVDTYTYTTEWHRLKKSTTTDYFGSKSVTTIQDYYYSSNPLLPSQEHVTASDGIPIITKNYYPDDVTSVGSLYGGSLTTTQLLALDKLKSLEQHRIAETIQTETYKDFNNNGIPETSELLSIHRTNYQDWGNNMVLPKDVQTLKGIYNSSNNSSNNVLEDRIVYVKYDLSNGNLLEVCHAGGPSMYYVWGYNGQYPIAKIENATYSQVSGQLSNLYAKSNEDNDRTRDTIDSNGNITKVGKEGDLREALRSLSALLPGSMVTTYTYDPLVGVTSITDPKGETVYYEYDSFNRLKSIRDAAGKLLSTNEYHYKNQQ